LNGYLGGRNTTSDKTVTIVLNLRI